MPARKTTTQKSKAPKMDPNWPGLKKKLQDAGKQLKLAQAQLDAIRKARITLEKAEATARRAVADAQAAVEKIEKTPPGQYPVVTR